MGCPKNIIGKFEKNILFLSFAIVFFLFLLSLLIFESTWATDDLLMAMHVSGKGFCNKPTEYILFSNILLGKFLKEIYNIIPSYPWYGFYTLFILFISFVVLLYSLLKYKYSRTRVFYFLIYFIFFGLFFIKGPEFTTNSFMIGMSGVFLLFANLYNERAVLSYKIIVMSMLLLSMSSLIRIDGFFLVMVLTSPLIIIRIVKNNFSKQIAGKILILFLSTFLIVFMSYIFNKNSYLKDKEWVNQFKKSKLLVEMVDNNKAYIYSPETKHIFDSVGWSRNDFLLKHNWFFADDKVFSKEKIEKILLGFNDIRIKRPTMHFESMFSDRYFYGAVLLIIFFVLQINEKKKNALAIAVSMIISLSVIIYLGYFLRLPKRIYFPILSFLSFLVLFFADKDITKGAIKENGNIFKFLFIFLFISYFLFIQYKINDIQIKGNFLIKHYINQLHPTKEHVFLVWAKTLPLEYISVFDNLDDFSEFKMLSTGHHFNSPVSAEILKEFNVKTFGELIEKDNLFHIGNLTYMALFAEYLKEHYNLNIAFKVYMHNPLFLVYKHLQITPELNSKLTRVPVNVEGFNYNIFAVKEQ